MQGFGIENSVPDVRVDNRADDHAVGSDLKGGPFLTLE